MNTYRSSYTPGAGVAQRKNGYQFTTNDRSSWFSAYFEVDFKVVQEANTEYLAATRIALIDDAASLIDHMQVKQMAKPSMIVTTYTEKSPSDDVIGLCK